MRKVTLILGICLLPFFLFAQFTLDDFSVSQTHENAVNMLSTPFSWQEGVGIVGGEREIITQLNVSSGNVTAGVAGGTLNFNAPSGQNANITVTYDGDEFDPNPGANNNGLGGMNFASHGSAIEVEVTAFSGTADFFRLSVGKGIHTGSQIDIPQSTGTHTLLFTDFDGNNANPINFTDVGVFFIQAKGAALSFSISKVRIVGVILPTFSVNNVSMTEGDMGIKNYEFSISRDDNSTNVSVDYQTNSGSASGGGDDFEDLPKTTLNFTAGGDMSKTVTVQVNGDELVEKNETFTVTLSDPVNSFIADGSGTGTIENDDVANLTIDDVSALETDAGTQFQFTVTLDNDVAVSGNTIDVDYETANGTATTGDSDYTMTSGTLNFTGTKNETKTFTVDITGDEKVELDEIFTVNLDNLKNRGFNVVIDDDEGEGTIENDDQAQISINDVMMDEGDSGMTDLVFTATLDEAVDVGVDVTFATSDNTATAGDDDYTTTSNTISFVGNKGETQQISIPVKGDEIVELDELFRVILSNIVAMNRNVVFADRQGEGTIKNDDQASISIADVSMDEGNSGNTTFSFTATLDTEVDVSVMVDYETADGDAMTGDSDYSMKMGTITFAGNAGETQTIEIEVTGDEKVELDENFFVDLSNIMASMRDVIFGDDQAEGIIENDDTAEFSIDDVSHIEGDAGMTDYVFSVTLSKELDVPATIDFASADNTATLANSDYKMNNGTLNFAGNAGETQTLTIMSIGDDVVELDESFFVNLSNIQASGRSVIISDGQGEGAIENDDSANFSISNVSMPEGSNGINTIQKYMVTMDSEVDVDVTIDFETQDGSAEDETGDFDYLSNSGTLTFNAFGGTNQTKMIMIDVTGDCVQESDENYTVDLSNIQANGRDAHLPGSPGQGTIENDDGEVFISDVTKLEGTGAGTTVFVFTVERTWNDCAFTIDYTTSEGTATLGDNDFISKSGTVTFNAGGGNTRSVVISVNKDAQVEPNENFFVNLSNPSIPVTITDSQGEGTIQNDDGATLSINDVTQIEGSGAVGNSIVFTVTLSENVASSLTVDYATQDGSAEDGGGDADYTAQTGTLNFNGTVGEQRFITIPVDPDYKVELDENFFVNLSNVQGGSGGVTIVDGQGEGNIQNDDSASLSIDDVSMTEGAISTTKTYTFTVSSTYATDVPFTIDFATVDDSATTGDNDYDANSGTLNFAGNMMETQTFDITVNGDCQFEADEDFFINLSNLQASGRNVSISDSQGTGTIQNDDTVPTISCPSNKTVSADGNCEFDLPDYTSEANFVSTCPGGSSLFQNPPSGTKLILGTHTITITGTDSGGAMASCNFEVTVNDDTNPTPQCQNISVFLNPNPSVTVTPAQINAGSFDNCGAVNLLSVAPNTFDCNDIGTNTVTLMISDQAGLQASCTATVTVNGIAVMCYLDNDGDSYGDLNNPQTFCLACGTGYVDNSTDCNDGNAAINPGTAELCDGIDNNCNGIVDEGFDMDGDGVSSCMGDCDDNDANNYTGNTEICDGQDNNCDGVIDEGFDVDGDGVSTCMGDCDDNDINNYPGNTEICDGQDNNCDGVVDEGFDMDGDGVSTCMGDCDDSDPNNFPGNPEICDGQDNNCNGLIDDGISMQTFVGNVVLMTQAQVDAFSNCIAIIDGDLSITGMGVNDLSPLSNLTEVTGDILIAMTALPNLNGLHNVTSLGEGLTLSMNNALNSLTHLAGITSIGLNLTIIQNGGLTSLSGLHNVTNIAGGLTLYLNTNLSDCCAIEPLIASGNILGSIFIMGNATGCETQSAITMSCSMAPLVGNPGNNNCSDCPLFPASVFQLQMEVYPNPNDGIFRLQIEPAYEKGKVEIVDITGSVTYSQVLDNQRWVQDIDVQHLPKGIYMLVVRADKKISSERVLIR